MGDGGLEEWKELYRHPALYRATLKPSVWLSESTSKAWALKSLPKARY